MLPKVVWASGREDYESLKKDIDDCLGTRLWRGMISRTKCEDSRCVPRCSSDIFLIGFSSDMWFVQDYRERLRPHIISPAPLLSHYSSSHSSNKNQILIEGCQALML